MSTRDHPKTPHSKRGNENLDRKPPEVTKTIEDGRSLIFQLKVMLDYLEAGEHEELHANWMRRIKLACKVMRGTDKGPGDVCLKFLALLKGLTGERSPGQSDAEIAKLAALLTHQDDPGVATRLLKNLDKVTAVVRAHGNKGGRGNHAGIRSVDVATDDLCTSVGWPPTRAARQKLAQRRNKP